MIKAYRLRGLFHRSKPYNIRYIKLTNSDARIPKNDKEFILEFEVVDSGTHTISKNEEEK